MSIATDNPAVFTTASGQPLRALLAVVLFVSISLALWPAPASLVRNWLDMQTYEHGPLVAAISLYWLYQRRAEFAATRWQFSVPALCSLIVLIGLWRVASASNSNIIMQLTWPAMLLLGLYAAAGWSVARIALVPVLYLYLAIPVWRELVPFLQWLTSVAAGRLLGLIGIQALVEANHVSIPAGDFVVIQDCAGERYLIVALAMAAMLAVTNRLRPRLFVVYMALAAVSAIVANWIRVTTVIAAGQFTDMQGYLVAKEHITFGLALFAVLLALLFWLGQRLARSGSRGEDAPGDLPSDPPQAASALTARVAAPVVVVVLLCGSASFAARVDAEGGGACLGSLAASLGEWQLAGSPDAGWDPVYPGAADRVRAVYAGPRGRLEVYINSYGRQTPTSKLISFDNRIAGAGRWEQTDLPGPTGSGWSPVTGLPRFLIRRQGLEERWVIGLVYRVGSVRTSSDAVAQVAYGLLSQTTTVPSGVVAVASRCDGDCRGELTEIRRFWPLLAARLPALTPGSRDCRLPH